MTLSVTTLRLMQCSPPDMEEKYIFCIRFSGITVRFTLPTPVKLQECFTNLMCEDVECPDAEYRVELISSPLCPDTAPVAEIGGTYVYNTTEGCLHIYTPLNDEDGCQGACLLSKNGKHTLFYPASTWEKHSTYWHVTHLLRGEALLLMHNAFLLHSSVVMIDGKTVLFSGPSGMGKSTQADLWKKYANAEIINGDRCVIMEKNGVFYGGGSLWCGTSGINRPEQAPIAGIFILEQSKENKTTELGARGFTPLFSQTTINSWDPVFINEVTTLYDGLLRSVPVYKLQCTPDKEAVKCAYRTLFGKELP